MAKKSGKKIKGSGKQTDQQTGGPGQRGIIYMSLLSLALAAWMVWRLEPSQGLGKALLWGGVFALAWLVFVGLYYMSQRRNRPKE